MDCPRCWLLPAPSLRHPHFFSCKLCLQKRKGSLDWPSWTFVVIFRHLSMKAAREWAVIIHCCNALFLRLKPTIPPFVLVLLFRVCSIVWSAGICENPKSLFNRKVYASLWVGLSTMEVHGSISLMPSRCMAQFPLLVAPTNSPGSYPKTTFSRPLSSLQYSL